MITKVRDTHCWAVMVGGDEHGTEIHFEDEAEFTAWASQYGYKGEPAHQLDGPCWLALCDTDGCDGCEGTEDADPGHIEALKELHVLAELGELTLDCGRLICPDCVEKAKPPGPPSDVRPSIVTYDEIGRAFGLLVQLRKQLPGYLPLDSVDQDVLTKVESLVGYHPVGPGRELAYVHPFAVQPPLPDMPPVSITTAGSLR